MSIENNRERTMSLRPCISTWRKSGASKHVAKFKTATKKAEGKERDKASLSLSLSEIRVEVRGGLRYETNHWRKYGSAATFLYFHEN
jgi:hypothetical protein